jgi:hypothetical protein
MCARSKVHLLIMVVVISFATSSSQSVSAQELQSVRYNIGCSSGNCVVSPWDAPAEQAGFRQNGVALESNSEILVEAETVGYRAALESFTSPESCLKNEAQSDNGFDLVLIDWGILGSLAEIEVCLARIHNAIRNSENSVLWFNSANFSAQARVRPKDHYREGWTDIYGSWTGEGAAPFPWYTAFFRRLLIISKVGVGMSFDQSLVVQNVNISFTME